MLYFNVVETDRFEQLVDEALDQLPDSFRALMDNVQVVVEAWPTPEQLRAVGSARGMTLLGLYEGIPRPRRGSAYHLVLPDKITIFQGPIERICQSEEEVRQQVTDTLIHEVGHHFGIDEERMAALEAERLQKRRERRATGNEP
jgi:predicted Zn-dependent protease with MMP-like domain